MIEDDMERELDAIDEAQAEHLATMRAICPHCAEPIGNESAGSNSGQGEWRHLFCLKLPNERIEEVVHLLHRLSLDELAWVDEHLHGLVQDPKWAEQPGPDRIPKCRRCTECVGQNHHWIEGVGDAEVQETSKNEMSEVEVEFECKHCGLTCPAKDPEAAHPEPDETRLYCACGLYPAKQCGVGCTEYPDG